MKAALSASVALVLIAVFAGCSSGDDPSAVGTAGEDLSAGATGPTTPPTAACKPSDCGPALGSPTLKCSDGSIGGNTGRCIRDAAAATCHWELRACPPGPTPVPVPPTPTPKRDCGKPGACTGPVPALLERCADGSTVGFECVDEGTACGWKLAACPVHTCGKHTCSSAQTCCVGVPFAEPTCINGNICPL